MGNMDRRHVRDILDRIEISDMMFHVSDTDPLFLQVQWCDPSAGLQHGRKWMLSPWMTRSEIVQTAFMAVLAFVEHEIRERFRYRGRAVFGPHFDVEQLVTLCDAKAEDRRA